MLDFIPFVCFVIVIAATLIRGRAVRTGSGVSAWAFFEARGTQRMAGLAFAASITALVAATALVATGQLDSAHAALAGGIAIMAAGTLLVVVAQRQMGAAWRVGVRDGDAPLFVTAGLFRFSRNPIFVGMIAMALGAALAIGTWWGWVAAAVFTIACHTQVRIEETHLRHEFGAAYDNFRQSTPRWLLW